MISVASLSKAYGLPGLRVGWLMTRDSALNETFLAAKEQMFICGAVLDEEIAYRVYARRTEELPAYRGRRRSAAGRPSPPGSRASQRWSGSRRRAGSWPFRASARDAGVDVPRFYQALNGKFTTFVGPGHWFEQDDRFMRVGFGWPTPEELDEGLASISASLRAARS